MQNENNETSRICQTHKNKFLWDNLNEGKNSYCYYQICELLLNFYKRMSMDFAAQRLRNTRLLFYRDDDDDASDDGYDVQNFPGTVMHATSAH